MPSRHELYEKKRTGKATVLQCAPAVALSGDYWTSFGNHNYLGVTMHYTDEKWVVHSHALSVMNCNKS